MMTIRVSWNQGRSRNRERNNTRLHDRGVELLLGEELNLLQHLGDREASRLSAASDIPSS